MKKYIFWKTNRPGVDSDLKYVYKIKFVIQCYASKRLLSD